MISLINRSIITAQITKKNHLKIVNNKKNHKSASKLTYAVIEKVLSSNIISI